MKKSQKSSRASQQLFHLIKSLSKSEKRYFKIYLKRNALGQDSASDKLFDAIDRQNKYDEEKLKKRFKDDSFSKNLSVAKNRLTENILKSLHFFHHQNSEENKFYTLLNEIEILYYKSLRNLCAKRLKQASKIAFNSKDQTKILKVLEWEKKLNIENREYKNLIEIALDELSTFKEINSLRNDIFKKQKNVQEPLNKLLERHPNNRVIKGQIHSCLSAIGYFHKDYALALLHSEKALKLLGEREVEERVSLLGNIVYLAVQLQQFDKAKTQLFNMKMLNKEFGHIPSLGIQLFENISSLELLIKSSEKKVEEAINCIPPIAAKLAHYNGEIKHDKRASFYLNFAQLYFLKNQFKEALKWSNELLNYERIEKDSEVYRHNLIFNLMVHFELGNKAFVQRCISKLQNRLRKENALRAFEQLFIVHIKKEQVNFELWLEEFQALNQSEKRSSLVQNFEFEKWLISKTKKVNMIYLI